MKPLFYLLIDPHLTASMKSTLRCFLCYLSSVPVLSSHVYPGSLQGHLIVSFTTSAVQGPEFVAFMISTGGFARCSAWSNVSSTIIGLAMPRSSSFWSRRIRYYGYLDETNLSLQDNKFQNKLFQRSADYCDDTMVAQICDGGTVGTLILRISDHRFVAVHICSKIWIEGCWLQGLSFSCIALTFTPGRRRKLIK